MSWDVARTTLNEFLSQLGGKSAPTPSILFFGGEPLLKWDLAERIMDLVRETRPDTAFDATTNGIGITPELARRAAQLGVKLFVSCDGLEGTHDRHRRLARGGPSFALVARALSILKEVQPWTGVRVTVHPDEVDCIAENVVGLHEKHGVNQFVIGPAYGLPWPRRRIARYGESLKRLLPYCLRGMETGCLRVGPIEQAAEEWVSGTRPGGWCGAGAGIASVAPDGTLYGCSKLAGAGKAGWPLGNVRDGWMTNVRNRLTLIGIAAGRRRTVPLCHAHCAFRGSDLYTAAPEDILFRRMQRSIVREFKNLSPRQQDVVRAYVAHVPGAVAHSRQSKPNEDDCSDA
jgi:sulfatase maturation enzyme AslB (radical SAM superfamily)